MGVGPRIIGIRIDCSTTRDASAITDPSKKVRLTEDVKEWLKLLHKIESVIEYRKSDRV